MNLSKAKLQQAIAEARQEPAFQNETDALDALAAVVATQPAEFAATAVLPSFADAPDPNDWPAAAFLAAQLAVRAVADGAVPASTRIEGNYEVKDTDEGHVTVVSGDLTVTGNFISEGLLVVLGDMRVYGAWVDEYAATIVAGSLTVGHSLLSEGVLAVEGKLTAPFVLFDYNQGYAVVLGGCQARLLIEDNHGGSYLAGPLQVDYLKYDEMHFEIDAPAMNYGALLGRLDELFQPEFAAPFAARYAAEKDQPGFEAWQLWDDFKWPLYQGFKLKNPNVFRY